MRWHWYVSERRAARGRMVLRLLPQPCRSRRDGPSSGPRTSTFRSSYVTAVEKGERASANAECEKPSAYGGVPPAIFVPYLLASARLCTAIADVRLSYRGCPRSLEGTSFPPRFAGCFAHRGRWQLRLSIWSTPVLAIGHGWRNCQSAPSCVRLSYRALRASTMDGLRTGRRPPRIGDTYGSD